MRLNRWHTNDYTKFVAGDIIYDYSNQRDVRLVVRVDDVAIWTTGLILIALNENVKKHPVTPMYPEDFKYVEMRRLGNLKNFSELVERLQLEIFEDLISREGYYSDDTLVLEDQKVLVPGLNFILVQEDSDVVLSNIIKKMHSVVKQSSTEFEASYCNINDLDKEDLLKSAVTARENGKVIIKLIWINNQCDFTPDKYKFSEKVFSSIEAANTVLTYNMKKNNFHVIKHRDNKDLVSKGVRFEDLI